MTRRPPRLSQLLRRRSLRWVLAGPLALTSWACGARDLGAPDPAPELQTDQYYELNQIRDVDILFLVDNSPSMEQEQANLAQNFPAFMDELKKIEGGLPNVHVAVVSSDLGGGATPPAGVCARPGGDRGVFKVNPGCNLDPNSKFIVSSNNGMTNNFNGDIGQVFSCLARIGVAGCGLEHQLAATVTALDEASTTENRGFLRPEAYLAVIIITDEDDCSAPPTSDLFNPAAAEYMGTAASFRCAQAGHICSGAQPPISDTYMAPLSECRSNDQGKLIPIPALVQALRSRKARPDQQIVVAGIFGWPDSEQGSIYRYNRPGRDLDYAEICQSANGKATAAVRVKDFVESFGESGSFSSICKDDFRPAMKAIGEKVAQKLSKPCVSAPLVDTNPSKPGLDAECLVSDTEPVAGGTKETPLPPCSSGKTPCWRLTEDATCTASNYKVETDRGGMLPKVGSKLTIKCRTCVKAGQSGCSR